MKKTIVILFLGVILLSGCGNKEERYKEILEGCAKTYYDKYMSGVDNQNQAEITLEMLKIANQYDGNFDLSELDKCDDSTAVTLTLNKAKQVVSYDFDLKCD